MKKATFSFIYLFILSTNIITAQTEKIDFDKTKWTTIINHGDKSYRLSLSIFYRRYLDGYRGYFSFYEVGETDYDVTKMIKCDINVAYYSEATGRYLLHINNEEEVDTSYSDIKLSFGSLRTRELEPLNMSMSCVILLDDGEMLHDYHCIFKMPDRVYKSLDGQDLNKKLEGYWNVIKSNYSNTTGERISMTFTSTDINEGKLRQRFVINAGLDFLGQSSYNYRNFDYKIKDGGRKLVLGDGSLSFKIEFKGGNLHLTGDDFWYILHKVRK